MSNEHESLRAWVKSGRPYTEQLVYSDKLLAEYDAAKQLLAEVLNGSHGIIWVKNGYREKVYSMDVTLPGTWVERAEAIVHPGPPEPEDESWRWL